MSTTAITYIGGPTAVLEYGGLRLITDPTFDQPGAYEEPGETTLVKTAGPAIARADIGPLDGVLLSHHAHKDNLDLEGMELIATGIPTLSTMDASAELLGVVGLDPWETYELGGVTVTAVPALHGPPGTEPLVGQVIGFVLEAPEAPTVYVSGDNASLVLVSQIADRFPDVSVAVIFAGAVRVPGIDGVLTLTSKDTFAAAGILSARIVVGVHTEDWQHFTETREDLEAAFADSGLLVSTPRGVRVVLR